MNRGYCGVKAAILGYGVSGKAAAQFLNKHGADLIIIDKFAQTLKQTCPFTIVSDTSDIDLAQFDFVVKSPGISRLHPLLKREGIQITSEIELACRNLQNQSKTLFAISGSNGKTTTTLFTTHLLNKFGIKAEALGNVGTPLLSSVDNNADVFVVELSSFQIEELNLPVFDKGAIINITPNHLDRYNSFIDYVSAKLHLQVCMKPSATLYLNQSIVSQFKNELFFPRVEVPKIETCESIAYHDVENITFAHCFGKFFGITFFQALEAWKDFQKPFHRQEFIGCLNERHFINDSKATSIDAVIQALSSLQRKGILILGGVDKGGDFYTLIPYLKGKIHTVFAMGPAASRIERELAQDFDVRCVEGLKQAVQSAYIISNKGDAILLSPGCSSYDQFKDYQERGDCFKLLFKELGDKS